jgi:hypothetical protein
MSKRERRHPDAADNPAVPGAGSPEHLADTLNVPASAHRFLAVSIGQDGGPANMPVRRASRHQYRAVLHEAIVRVADALEAGGIVDTHGRLRRAWITSLESLIREARALDETLGLEGTAERGAAAGDSAAGSRRPSLPAELEAFLDRMDDVVGEPDKDPSTSL